MMYRNMLRRKPLMADKRLKTNARFWQLALACRVDADPVRDIQGCTPK